MDKGTESSYKGRHEKEEPSQEKRTSKLQFDPDETPRDKKLNKAVRKAERTADKLEAAKENLPTRRKRTYIEKYVDDEGNVKSRVAHEMEVKPQREHVKGPKPLRPIHKAKNTATGYAHKKVHEVEDENVGTEAAHRAEILAEGGLRVGYRRMKTKPYRRVKKLNKKFSKHSAKASYRQMLHDNPELNSNPLSHFWQKQRIQRGYAKAAREAQRAAAGAKTSGSVASRAAHAAVGAVKRHPAMFLFLAVMLLLLSIFSSMLSAFSSMGMGGMTTMLGSSYLASDKDIDDAELNYTQWEVDLQIKALSAERTHPGYDYYHYEIDDMGHDPYELMAFLTASYQSFTFEDIQGILKEIFDEQYTLTYTPTLETRYKDPDDENGDGDKEPYEARVLNVSISAHPLTGILQARMNAEQQMIYKALMQTYGNRQYIQNIFKFNWMPYVSDFYGYRIHPISGKKDYHKGIDIAVASGTEILAGHDGVVMQAGNAGNYGLVVVLEGETPAGTLTTKYAHCSKLLVSVGQQVKAGDVIAKVGNTGQSTGPHLHLEILMDGQYLNPLYFATTGDDGTGSLPPGTIGGPEIPAYPGEPMGDGSYAALIEEAQKHLGKPYVFGASGPNSFDCSGYVCYVLKHSGVKDVGRITAQGLYNLCTPVSRANTQPGDLIFFTGTYNAGRPVTHVGIYIGNGQMIHAGKPVSYSSIDTPYWTKHFYAFGRL